MTKLSIDFGMEYEPHLKDDAVVIKSSIIRDSKPGHFYMVPSKPRGKGEGKKKKKEEEEEEEKKQHEIIIVAYNL